MLAGRKLLLADDSITIQKVVELTFADEQVTVVCVNNGREAIERLEEFLPDIVLADVFMPQLNGYEVCEYIKQNKKFKHIPVMLLVGSFEPFDEEEARRVGANDTLTKPFQSIRRLLDKVGLLTSSRPPEEQVPTADLPKPEVSRAVTSEPEGEHLSEAEIEITTADTQPLPAGLRHVVEKAAASQARKEGEQLASGVQAIEAQPAGPRPDAKLPDGMRENKTAEPPRRQVSEAYDGAGETLLDLGDYNRAASDQADDFVLDIDLDEVPEPSPVEATFSAAAFRNRDRYKAPGMPGLKVPATTDQLADTQEFQRNLGDTPKETMLEAQTVEVPAAEDQAGQTSQQAPAATATSSNEPSAQQLSPETIDAISRRVVEQLSTKVVEEIAWQVVPQLAELMIRKQLEEKNS